MAFVSVNYVVLSSHHVHSPIFRDFTEFPVGYTGYAIFFEFRLANCDGFKDGTDKL